MIRYAYLKHIFIHPSISVDDKRTQLDECKLIKVDYPEVALALTIKRLLILKHFILLLMNVYYVKFKYKAREDILMLCTDLQANIMMNLMSFSTIFKIY